MHWFLTNVPNSASILLIKIKIQWYPVNPSLCLASLNLKSYPQVPQAWIWLEAVEKVKIH
jgi:hypothetical protein